MLWADLAHKLTDQVVTPLNTYQAQFPEMRVSNAPFSTILVSTPSFSGSRVFPCASPLKRGDIPGGG